jgi:4-phospho-D-threonate 3-dehydrogenase / 4-phospho-D-erythronate 3-dehydrogenase
MSSLPTVLLTIGDVTSSAPELAVKAALDVTLRKICVPVLIGSEAVIEDARRRLSIDVPVSLLDSSVYPSGVFDPDVLGVIHFGDLSVDDYEKGVPAGIAGVHATEVAREACRLIAGGLADAVCSAPTSKVSLALAGSAYSGMSDVFAEFFGVDRFESLLVLDDLRFLVSTNHIPFRDIPTRLSSGRLLTQIVILRDELKAKFGISAPRIGISALNPHGGEGGLYGREEIDIIVPAIEGAQKIGIDVHGPIPADFLIDQYRNLGFDGAVMLYHDQAQIPLKVIGGYRLATLLLGLPIVRTSVAHGTAYGKARSGTADPKGMIDACKLAAEVSPRRT